MAEGMKTVRGRVLDAERVGMSGVAVSNGLDVVLTEHDGAFELPVPSALQSDPPALPGNRWIVVTTPSGYRATDPVRGWFRDLTRNSADDLTFHLERDEARAGDAFTCVQMNDLHLGEYPFAWLEEDLAHIRANERIDAVACVGDMTQSGKPEELAEYFAVCGRSGLPFIHVPGNHEWIADRNGENWSDAFGPHFYSLEWGPFHIVVSDSSTERYPGAYRQDQWILNDLAMIPEDRPVIVLIHHQREDDFYSRLRHRRIVASLSGHWHSSRLYDDGHTVHINQPSSTMGGIDYAARGYTVVRIDENCEVGIDRRLLGTSDRASRTGVASIPDQPATGIDKAAPIVRTDGDWSQFHGGPRRGGRADTDVPLPLRRAWQTRLPGGVLFNSPVIAGDRVFMTVMDEEDPRGGQVLCLDARDGSRIWQSSTGGSIKHAAAVSDGMAYATTITGNVLAFDTDTGERVWEYQLGDPSARWIFSAPLVAHGKVFAGASSHFAALNAKTGEPIWVRDDLRNTDWISSYVSPTADDECVYIGFFWHYEVAWALEIATGETRWVIEEPNRACPAGSLVFDDGTLYATCHDGTVRAHRTSDAEELWRFDLEQNTNERWGSRWSPGTPAVADGVVYAPTGDGAVRAIDVATGTERWQWWSGDSLAGVDAYARESRGIFSSPLVTHSHVILGTNDGRIVALDRGDGKLIWQDHLHAPVASPALSGNLLTCAASDGWLYGWTCG